MAEEIKEEKIEKEAAKPEEKKDEQKEKSESKNNKKQTKEIGELKKKVEEAEAKTAELNDKYLRMMAEYENFRKRAAKEKEGIYSDAKLDVIKELLPTLDNLERAVAFEESGKLAEGVQMTLNMLKSSLEKLGVTEIEAQGAEFDPNLHNAVMHVEDESLGENTVVEVFGKGYKIGDKVIRYAMVKVAN